MVVKQYEYDHNDTTVQILKHHFYLYSVSCTRTVEQLQLYYCCTSPTATILLLQYQYYYYSTTTTVLLLWYYYYSTTTIVYIEMSIIGGSQALVYSQIGIRIFK